jgi:hypothetical protein
MDMKFNEEMLSAYLDGELSAQEAATVENALEDDSKLRRLLEDLSTLQHSLQTLPAHRYDDDCSASVLRRAERTMLIGSPRRETQRAPSDEAPGSVSLRPNYDTPKYKKWFAALAVVSAVAVFAVMVAPHVSVPKIAQSSPETPESIEAEEGTQGHLGNVARSQEAASTPVDPHAAEFYEADDALPTDKQYADTGPAPAQTLAERRQESKGPAPTVSPQPSLPDANRIAPGAPAPAAGQPAPAKQVNKMRGGGSEALQSIAPAADLPSQDAIKPNADQIKRKAAVIAATELAADIEVAKNHVGEANARQRALQKVADGVIEFADSDSVESFAQLALERTGTRPDIVVRLDVAASAWNEQLLRSKLATARDDASAATRTPQEHAKVDAFGQALGGAGSLASGKTLQLDRSTKLVVVSAAPEQVQMALASLQLSNQGIISMQSVPVSNLAFEKQLAATPLSAIGARADKMRGSRAATAASKEAKEDRKTGEESEAPNDARQFRRDRTNQSLGDDEKTNQLKKAVDTKPHPKTEKPQATTPPPTAASVSENSLGLANRESNRPAESSAVALPADQLSVAGTSAQLHVLFIIKSVELSVDDIPGAAASEALR